MLRRRPVPQQKDSSKKPKCRAGRKGYFKDEMLHQVYCFALLGATDQQIADFFRVDVTTIDYWKKNKPDFLRAMKRGKTEADAQVAKSFFQRALGYSHPDTHIMSNRVKIYDEKGRVIEEHTEPLLVPIIKHYPPEVTAGIFWLKNRQRLAWVDVSEYLHKHSGTIDVRKVEEIPLEELSPEQQEMLFTLNLKQLESGGRSSN